MLSVRVRGVEGDAVWEGIGGRDAGWSRPAWDDGATRGTREDAVENMLLTLPGNGMVASNLMEGVCRRLRRGSASHIIRVSTDEPS